MLISFKQVDDYIYYKNINMIKRCSTVNAYKYLITFK